LQANQAHEQVKVASSLTNQAVFNQAMHHYHQQNHHQRRELSNSRTNQKFAMVGMSVSGVGQSAMKKSIEVPATGMANLLPPANALRSSQNLNIHDIHTLQQLSSAQPGVHQQ